MLSHVEHDTEDLAEGTRLLRGQYVVEGALAKGGFGITYLARDSLDRKVVIKECYPHAYCMRVGSQVAPATPDDAPNLAQVLKQFQAEAFRLAALDHPHVVGVHQVFEENGTSYLAMEHIDGDDLFTVVEADADRLTAPVTAALLVQCLEAVQFIHDQGLLHRDLAPDNMILGADGHLTLIDFGAAWEMHAPSEGGHGKMLVVKDGYSPYEFYCDADQDASSDLYQLAATFHYLITGYSPPDSHVRMAAVQAERPDPYVPLTAEAWGIDQAILDTLNAALCLSREDRPQSAHAWLLGLDGVSDQPAVSAIRAPQLLPDPVIADEIARLVTATNSDLARSLADQKSMPDQETGRVKEAQTPEPKQLVDLFGNPVHDVDAFLREQDAPKKTKAKLEISPAPDSTVPEPVERPIQTPSVMGRALAKLLPKKSSFPSAVPQN